MNRRTLFAALLAPIAAPLAKLLPPKPVVFETLVVDCQWLDWWPTYPQADREELIRKVKRAMANHEFRAPVGPDGIHRHLTKAARGEV